MRRVAITGMGVISPIGSGLEKFWSAIKEGKCGIDEITAFDTTDFTVKLAGEVDDFDPKDYMDKKEAKRMDRFCQFAIGASQMAIDDSGLELEKIDKEKIGVVIGSGCRWNQYYRKRD